MPLNKLSKAALIRDSTSPPESRGLALFAELAAFFQTGRDFLLAPQWLHTFSRLSKKRQPPFSSAAMLLMSVGQGNGPEAFVTKPTVSRSFASRTSPPHLSVSVQVSACGEGGVHFLRGRPPFNTKRVRHGVAMHHIVALNIESCLV